MMTICACFSILGLGLGMLNPGISGLKVQSVSWDSGPWDSSP